MSKKKPRYSKPHTIKATRLPEALSDSQVLLFDEWCQLNRLSDRGGRRILLSDQTRLGRRGARAPRPWHEMGTVKARGPATAIGEPSGSSEQLGQKLGPQASTDKPEWSIGATNNVRVDAIQTINRILPTTPERIIAMANALGERGQLTPILVTKHGKEWRVVAGATRLGAAVELGWEYIKATIVSGTEQELQLMEIEENLDRADWTDTERALLKAKHKELRAARLTAFEMAMENTPPAPAAKGGRGKKGGVADAARKAGVPENLQHDGTLNPAKMKMARFPASRPARTSPRRYARSTVS